LTNIFVEHQKPKGSSSKEITYATCLESYFIIDYNTIMEKHPHITFHLNKTLDLRIAVHFFKFPEARAGFDFIKEICQEHPKMKPFLSYSKKKRAEAVIKYVKNFYKIEVDALKKAKKDFQCIWDKIENDFFNLCEPIFGNLPWPSGKYEGYISILPIGPRFLTNKTFQTYWLWRNNLKGQVIHELLHFQFYNLIDRMPDAKSLSNDKIWQLSEIFNDIVQKEKDFVKIQGYVPKQGYPDHIPLLPHYRTIWEKNKTAEGFIRSCISE